MCFQCFLKVILNRIDIHENNKSPVTHIIFLEIQRIPCLIKLTCYPGGHNAAITLTSYHPPARATPGPLKYLVKNPTPRRKIVDKNPTPGKKLVDFFIFWHGICGKMLSFPCN